MLLIVVSRTVMNLPTVTPMNRRWNSPDNTQWPTQWLCTCWQECMYACVIVCLHLKVLSLCLFCTSLFWVQGYSYCSHPPHWFSYKVIKKHIFPKCTWSLSALKCCYRLLNVSSVTSNYKKPPPAPPEVWHDPDTDCYAEWITDGNVCAFLSLDSQAEHTQARRQVIVR